MSSIELKPCPFCGGEAEIQFGACDYNVYQVVCTNDGCNAMNGWDDTPEQAAEAWNRRADNKPIRQSCKSCKQYTPDPNYRDGDMGNCRYLEKIWEKPFYVNEARAECEHFQAAERINENGNET